MRPVYLRFFTCFMIAFDSFDFKIETNPAYMDVY
jgi:hypothetical protein